MVIKYKLPENWIKYDPIKIASYLTNAKAVVLALVEIPYQRSWIEKLQIVQLKREVAGTSRIEGADFTENELDAAMEESPKGLLTRSQRQAAASVKTYRWIAKLPRDRNIDKKLVKNVHSIIVKDADDDHCVPGKIRTGDENITFGIPRHRGADGGEECTRAFDGLLDSVTKQFPKHDILVQALAFHFHFAAMHPFLDGNGRVARTLEALMLQKASLRDSLFIAMSNYYYEEKNEYLKCLGDVRAANHDLTPFLIFGLKGIELQCSRLFQEIKKNVSKALYRDVMYDLFNRLKTERKRVIASRQIELLKLLLEESITLRELQDKTKYMYAKLKEPGKGLIRDLNGLISLGAIGHDEYEKKKYMLFVRLEWPTEITETEFFKRVESMPRPKTQIIRFQ